MVEVRLTGRRRRANDFLSETRSKELNDFEGENLLERFQLMGGGGGAAVHDGVEASIQGRRNLGCYICHFRHDQSPQGKHQVHESAHDLFKKERKKQRKF